MSRGELVAGDVVRVVGGGPSMTVERADDHMVSCVWFDDLGHAQRGDFLRGTLVKREDRGARDVPMSRPPISGDSHS